MRYFFTPGIALMNRLGYTKKFTLLWLTSLIAIAVVVSSLYSSLEKEIRSSQRELEGIALATPISRTVQYLQQHRGLSSALLGGNLDMRARRIANEKNVAATFNELEEKLPTGLRMSEDWHSIKTNWGTLQKEGLHWSVDKNFAVHTRLIDQLLLFKVTVSGEYVLPLDPQIDTSYLIDTAINRLPMALEHLGQARAYCTRILAKKHATEYQIVTLHTLIAQLDDELKFLKINLDKAGRYNPAIQSSLSTTSRDIASLAQQTVDLVQSDIMTGHFATPPEDFFAITTEAIDKGYMQMHESLLPKTEALIKARIARAEHALRTSIGIASLLFMVVVYLTVGIYYATIGSIQALARSARTFASGDMNERIDLGTRDELRQVCDSFNAMADGFNAMLAARQEDETRLRITIETALDAVVQMDAAGIITGWNSQAANIFGWSREEAIGRKLGDTIIPLRYRDAHAHGLQHFLESGKAVAMNTRIELPGLHRDGHEFPVELAITPVKLSGKYEFNAFIRDITKKKESEELIWKQANFDTLTGLPNRNMFFERLEQETRKAHRSGLSLTLLFIDLDKFKEVNDTLGHDVGDKLLVEAARRISMCVRETDTVARIGGDEFTVILPDLDDPNKVDGLAQNIIQRLAEPFQLEHDAVYVTASVGITMYPTDATEIEELFKNADLAMYVAKNLGRNRHSYFTPALQEAAQMRLRLINDLRGALAANQFRVHFQPMVDMLTGRINKAEALIRWQHPVRGLVNPAEFIPLSEETGLIVEIGDWMFRESVRWAKRWRTLHNAEFQVSVNKSPIQFRSDSAMNCKTWPAYLREMEMPGQSLVIEITEGLLLDEDSYVTAKLLEFHDAGIQVSIDDFGTGYSSLSYLKKFNIDYLKIDQSFTRNLAPGSSDMALSEAIVVMAHKLGFQVVAEGVETEAQQALLATIGCNFLQGYLFSKPVPPEEFEVLLKRSVSA